VAVGCSLPVRLCHYAALGIEVMQWQVDYKSGSDTKLLRAITMPRVSMFNMVYLSLSWHILDSTLK
jgi:hypothetical protein